MINNNIVNWNDDFSQQQIYSDLCKIFLKLNVVDVSRKSNDAVVVASFDGLKLYWRWDFVVVVVDVAVVIVVGSQNFNVSSIVVVSRQFEVEGFSNAAVGNIVGVVVEVGL